MKRLAIAAIAVALSLEASAFESYMMHVPDSLGASEGSAGFKAPFSFPKGISIPLKDGSRVAIINGSPFAPGEGAYGSLHMGEVKNVADGDVVSRMANAAARLPTVKVNMGGVTLFAIFEDAEKMYYGQIVSRGGCFDVFIGLPKGRVFDEEIRGVLSQVEFVPPPGFGVDSALKLYGKESKMPASAKFAPLKKMVEERAECVELIEALADAARETGHADTLQWCEDALRKLNPAVYAPDGVNSVKDYDRDDDELSKIAGELFRADSRFEKATASIPPVEEAAPVERRTKTVMLPGDVPMEFIWCEKGTFTMGQNDGELDISKKEEPRHKVTLTKGFWLAKYETTQRQWKSVTGDNPSGFTGDDDLPVDNVTWKQCNQFAETLAERSGIRLRLPTEAEWEYACRAGTRTTFYWGNHDTTKKANFNGRIFPRDDEEVYLEKTVKTGSYEPNPWGFFDMAGNVAEWCEDDWVDEPSPENQKDPLLVNPEAIRKAIRGGAWWTPGQSCRSASRSGFWTGDASTGNGVRFAMDE